VWEYSKIKADYQSVGEAKVVSIKAMIGKQVIEIQVNYLPG